MPGDERGGAVADRLSSLDVSFLYLEEPTTPMHVGNVDIFQVPDSGFDHDRLVRLIRERIAFVPRYRQRIRWVPGRLAHPVWVDDEHFDVTYHVRRSALPRPGTMQQLEELVARIMSRPLDRNRPLWEMYLVEGLEGGRLAILSKTHNAMVDGLAAVDIGQVFLDVTAEPRPSATDTWRPTPEPTSLELLAGVVGDAVRRPALVVDDVRDRVRGGVDGVKEVAAEAGRHTLSVLGAALRMARPPAEGPLRTQLSEQRRFATASVPLEDLRKVRAARGGTINDGVLTVIAGGLRAWLLTRGESVDARAEVATLVPVSVHGAGARGPATHVDPFLVHLPVGEPDAIIRLQRISYEMTQHGESGRLLGAPAIAGVVGFAPPTLHALGARVGSSVTRRAYELAVTNVPGPQHPLYAAGARMLASYPVAPLVRHQALAIGVTSYDGRIFFGLNADRDAMPDLDVLAHCVHDAVDELVEASRRPRARTSPSSTKAAGVP